MRLHPLEAPRFIRRTTLGPNEYRKDFRQIDSDVIRAVTSAEADRVTPLMGKIYLRLVNAPPTYWERDGVLRFESEVRDDGHVTAWEALCELAGVASATARKAIQWMHGQGIVGYFAGKNGVGIRVFLNRAASSIGTKSTGQKILEFPRASSRETHTSRGEAAFSDSFADPEVLDTDSDPRAPKDGAEKTKVVKEPPDPYPPHSCNFSQRVRQSGGSSTQAAVQVEMPVEEIVSRLRCELEPSLQSAARQAAAREHERTREWLENKGLPKVARVAQREAFNVLRHHGLVGSSAGNAAVGRGMERAEVIPSEARPLTADEVRELAQASVAMLEVHGHPLDVTVAEMGIKAGGFLSPVDAPRVRELAEALARDGRQTGHDRDVTPKH